jgi:dolichyl-phosphate beta-glucosyltransferase
MSNPELSIVIPCFNEEKRVHLSFEEILKFHAESPISFEVIFVNDGSSDKTVPVIEDFISSHTRLSLSLIKTEHRGKGNAVRRGLDKSEGLFVLFSDTDFSTPLNEIENFLPLLKKGKSLVCGLRKKYHTKVSRKIISTLFTGVRHLFFPFLRTVTDTQCGFKCMKSSTAHNYAEQGVIDGLLFDMELLLFCGREKMAGVSVCWNYVTGSSILSLSSFKQIFEDFFKLLFIEWRFVCGSLKTE